MAEILALPLEILERISFAVAPGDLVNYALACKSLLLASARPLAEHREILANRTHAVLQDVEALELPLFVRAIIRGDDRRAWYLKKVIWWSRRIRFREWKRERRCYESLSGDEDMDEDDFSAYEYEEEEIPEHILEFWDPSDLAAIRKMLTEAVKLPDLLLTEWMAQVEQGSQEILKCLIAAICPNAHTFVVTMCGKDFGSDNKNCIPRFREAIEAHAQQEGVPVNVFGSLKHVYLQHGTDLVHGHDQFSLTEEDGFAFMKLPSISTLSLHLGGFVLEGTEWRYEKGTSRLENLVHENSSFPSGVTFEMVEAMKSVKTLKIEYAKQGSEGIEKVLESTSIESLESLKFERGGVDLTLGTLHRFQRLKHISVSIKHLAIWRSDPPRQPSTIRPLRSRASNGQDEIENHGDDIETEHFATSTPEHNNRTEPREGNIMGNDINAQTFKDDPEQYASDGGEYDFTELEMEEQALDTDIGGIRRPSDSDVDKLQDSDATRMIGWINLRDHLPRSLQTLHMSGQISFKHIRGFVDMVCQVISAKSEFLSAINAICLNEVKWGSYFFSESPSRLDIYLMKAHETLQELAKQHNIEIHIDYSSDRHREKNRCALCAHRDGDDDVLSTT